MKKNIILILCLLIFNLILFNIAVSANTTKTDDSFLSSVVICYDDGSYLVINLYTLLPTSTNTYLLSPNASYEKIGRKENIYSHSDGSELWKFTVTGLFLVTPGEFVECTYASYSHNIYNSAWHFSNGESQYYDNVAYGKGTFKQKVLLITVKTVNVEISINCDVQGNLY